MYKVLNSKILAIIKDFTSKEAKMMSNSSNSDSNNTNSNNTQTSDFEKFDNNNHNNSGVVGTNFIQQIIQDDINNKKFLSSEIITRFPPEPNGFLHIGHAKSINLNFGLAKRFGGKCHLRFDDTNPQKEEQRYIDAILADVKWLGGDWNDNLYYASDYFDQLFDWALQLTRDGLAYVDNQTIEDIRINRGTLTTPGIPSPYRERSIEENVDIFLRMKAGEFDEGSAVLRAKIDMSSGNMNMRDPILYRILKQTHPRTGSKWCIYPLYDFTHGQSDSIENISHSICTLEFELHRELYDWFQDKLKIYKTRQIEFARLNITYMLMSKRRLLALVEEGFVDGWDDPRMPTLAGLRRRGVPPQALLNFCDRIGVAKRENVINLELLELCTREEMHTTALRRFGILRPLKVVIENIENDDFSETLIALNHPDDISKGERELIFSKYLYIDEDDFMEYPSSNFHRLSLNKEVRLRYGYYIRCNKIIKKKDDSKIIDYLLCSYDKTTKGGSIPSDGRKVKSTIHWLSEKNCSPAEIRIFSRLFTKPFPEEINQETPNATWRDAINPLSKKVYSKALVEPIALNSQHGEALQFERIGFFTKDIPVVGAQKISNNNDNTIITNSSSKLPIFNLTVELSDSFTSSQADSSESKRKENEKKAREKAAEERRKIKEDREKRKLEKNKK